MSAPVTPLTSRAFVVEGANQYPPLADMGADIALRREGPTAVVPTSSILIGNSPAGSE
jgi:hypothetical protein